MRHVARWFLIALIVAMDVIWLVDSLHAEYIDWGFITPIMAMFTIGFVSIICMMTSEEALN